MSNLKKIPFQIIRCKSTIKSFNDETKNQALIARLKGISVKDERRKLEVPQSNDEGAELRKLTMQQITKFVKLYTNDPLIWNPSVLSRIFDIPECLGKELAHHVQPLCEYSGPQSDEVITLVKSSIVIDVTRLK